MNPGPTVFAQVLAGLDHNELSRAAARFPMPRASRSFTVHDHFAAMIFAQLTYRESLRGIEACLMERRALAYHMGIRGRVTRTNLADANEHRDWRVFAEIASVLMRRAQRLYGETPPELGLEADLFALDAGGDRAEPGVVPVGARAEGPGVGEAQRAAGRNDRPGFASLHEGNRHEVASRDESPVFPGCDYAIERGYLDCARLLRLHQAGAFFVTRLKAGLRYYVVASRPVDPTAGLRCDQTIRLNSAKGRAAYPEPLRRISYVDPESWQALIFLTNQFDLPAVMIAAIYRRRWAIERFFRWIKQQKHRAPSMDEILQIVSASSFEQIPLPELFMKSDTSNATIVIPKQLEINYS